MSSVDERIVRMEFDNTNFESGATKAVSILEKLEKALNFKSASDGLDNVKSSLNNFNMDSVSDAVEECSNRFSAFDAFVTGIFFNLGNKAANFATNLLRNLTVKPLMDGFSEYQTQIGSVQTILSNAGDKLKAQGFTTQEEQIERINATLDELNEYADKTIYNFSEMTRNIGTFTAAGVNLDTATTSIQGIANLAAASGSTSQQASTAMYQLSQAIAAGTVKLQDWNSVVNAGMGGELFQNALKRTARAHGVAVDEMIEKNGSFRESLQEGWITSDILTETLSQLTMATEGLTDAEIEEMKVSLQNQGYSREDAEAILELANNAEQAATKVRTWSQLWDTVGEALGSGWATTWRTVVGDFIEATDLFTHLSKRIGGIINASSNARNAVLADWAEKGGRTALVDGIKFTVDGISSIISEIGRAFSDVFGISGDQLFHISEAFKDFAKNLVPTKEQVQFLYDVLYDVFTVIHSVLGVFGNFVRIIFSVAKVVWKLIAPFVKLIALLGKGFINVITRASSFILLLTDKLEDFVGFITKHFGKAIDTVYGLFSKFWNIIKEVVDSLGGAAKVVSTIGGAFLTVFGGFVSSLGPVQKMKDALVSLKDTVSGKLQSVFDKFSKSVEDTGNAQKKAATKFENLTPYQKFEVALEELTHKTTTFLDKFKEAPDKVKFIGDALSSSFEKVKNKAKEFFEYISNPSAIYNSFEVIDSKIVDGIFDIFGHTELAEQLWGAYNSIAGPLFDFFHKTIADSKTWGEVFKGSAEKASKAIDTVKTSAGKLKTYFTELGKSGKTLPQMMGTVLSDAYSKVKEWVGKIPEFVSKAKDKTLDAFNNFASTAVTFKDKIVSTFRDLLSKLPDPAELGARLGGLFSGVKDSVSSKFSGIDFSGIKDGLSNALGGIGKYISGIKISIPDNFLGSIWESIKKSISEKFNTGDDGKKIVDLDKIEETISNIADRVKQILKDQAGSALIVTIMNFINSLSSLNRGLGKFGKKFSKSFESFGKSIGNGLENFGKGFTKGFQRKETKADAFKKVATGMLLLAGALWVLSKIPSDRLMEVALTLTVLGGMMSAFMLAASEISKVASLNLEGVGKAIAGFGIGLLALAAAAFVLSKLEDPDKTWQIIGQMAAMMVTIGALLALIAASGGDMKGVAASIVTMGITILLMVAAIEILGRTPDEVLQKGGQAVTQITFLIGAIVGMLEMVAKYGRGGTMAGAAACILALSIAVTLLIIPIEILGRTPDDVLKKGGVTVGIMTVVLALAVGLIGLIGIHAASIAAGTIAILALTIAVTFLTIPVEILGNMDPGKCAQGVIAVGIMAVLLGVAVGLIGVIGVNALSIAAGTIALLALTVAVGAMTLVVQALADLAAKDPGSLIGACTALFVIIGVLVAGLAGIGAVGPAAGTGMLLIAAGIAAIGAALMVLAAGIMVLQSGPDWSSIGEGISNIGNAVSTFATDIAGKAKEAVSNFFSELSDWPSKAGKKVGEVVTSCVDALKDLPSKMLSKAKEGVTNFLSGITGKQSSVKSKSKEMTNNAVTPLNDLKTKMKTKGSDGAQGLVTGIGSKAGSVRSAASRLASSASGGIGSLYSRFHSVGSNAGQGLVDGLGSKFAAIANKAASMVKSAISAAKRTAEERSPSRVFRRIGAYCGEGYIIGMISYFDQAAHAGSKLAQSAIDSTYDAMESFSIDLNDVIDADVSPVITPVLNPNEVNAGINRLSATLNRASMPLTLGQLNYTGELSAKIDDYNDVNRKLVSAIEQNGIDYGLLGNAVVAALINSGVYVRMDGGQMVGYLAGEIRDARQMYHK